MKSCNHYIGESYLNGATNTPPMLDRMIEMRYKWRHINNKNWKLFGDTYIKEYFRTVFKLCPLCGKKLNAKKLLHD